MDMDALIEKWKPVLNVTGDRIQPVTDIHVIMDICEMLELIQTYHFEYAKELAPFTRMEFPWMDAIERRETLDRYRGQKDVESIRK